MQPAPLPERLPRTGFTTNQARIVGVSRARSRAGDLIAPYARTRVDRNTPFGLKERCRVVLGLLRPDAFVCGPTAAALHGMPLPDGMASNLERRVDVAVPPTCRAPRIRGIRGRALAVGADDIDRRHGFRATTPERTWCDLAGELGLLGYVVVRVTQADLESPDRMIARIERHLRRRGWTPAPSRH